jgi:predicted helicase
MGGAVTRDILRESDNWPDFQRRLQPLTEKSKGDCFESLTKYFLQLHPTYATKLKNVWSLKEVPVPTRAYLNLPGPDEGIDLIAETKEGAFWAIHLCPTAGR